MADGHGSNQICILWGKRMDGHTLSIQFTVYCHIIASTCTVRSNERVGPLSSSNPLLKATFFNSLKCMVNSCSKLGKGYRNRCENRIYDDSESIYVLATSPAHYSSFQPYHFKTSKVAYDSSLTEWFVLLSSDLFRPSWSRARLYCTQYSLSTKNLVRNIEGLYVVQKCIKVSCNSACRRCYIYCSVL